MDDCAGLGTLRLILGRQKRRTERNRVPKVPLLPCVLSTHSHDARAGCQECPEQEEREWKWEREELEHVGVLEDDKPKAGREKRDGKSLGRRGGKSHP